MERIREIEEILRRASEAYYNGVEIMANFEYDALEKEYTDLCKKYGVEPKIKVGAKIDSRLPKITHKFPAKSLAKTKDADELVKVFSEPKGLDGEVCLSWKLDGLTVQLTYEGGNLVNGATRGDGVVGQDITKNLKYFRGVPSKIPYNGTLVVRGEATMSYADFERVNESIESEEDKFANPRNLASSTVTLVDETEFANRQIEFRAFELVYWDVPFSNLFHDKLKFLKSCQFGVVPFEVCSVERLKDAIDRWSVESYIKDFGTPVDGLVIAYEDTDYTKDLEGTEHHPNPLKGMAFKWKDETVETTIRNIEWSASRTGLLNPVAIFDTVSLEGTKVSRASLHNLSIMRHLHIHIGDRVTVFKANKIIPQVAENLSEDTHTEHDYADYYSKVECPICGQIANVHNVGGVETMHCDNSECGGKIVGNLSHFCSKGAMNIDGISESTLDRMVFYGWIKTYADLYHLSDFENEIIATDGFGQRSYDNMIGSIEDSRNTDFVSFISALSIPGIGRGQAKLLKEFLTDIKPDSNPINEFIEYRGSYNIKGIGDKTNEILSMWREMNLKAEWFTRLVSELRFKDETKKVSSGSSISGMTFVITGSLNTYKNRDELVAKIESLGGKVSGSVSSKTNYLINNDTESTSGKNKKAKELGISIISEEMFNNMIQ